MWISWEWFLYRDISLMNDLFKNNEFPHTITTNYIINYNDTISNLFLTEYENGIPSCNCDKSKYCYAPHGHVITGDLKIINNKKLRSLVSKGPKYREQNIINWNINKRIIMDAIDIYIYMLQNGVKEKRPLVSQF